MKIGVRIWCFRIFCVCQFYKNIKRILFQQTMLSHEYFRDLLKLLCKGICYALSLCKVKALLGFQNLHAYRSYFGAKPCIDVHNTFLRHIISNKSRK